MVVERITWRVRHAHHKEFIQLLRAFIEGQGKTPRIYSYLFGDRDVVTLDLEFESMADLEQYMAGFDQSQPDWVAFARRAPDLEEAGIIRELLEVH